MRTALVLTVLFGVTCSTVVPFKRLSAADNEELQKTCGYMRTPLDASDSSRVLDGDVVIPGYADWVVRIEWDTEMHCTGALISSRHVLTASHCHLDNSGRYQIRVGRDCSKLSCTQDMEKYSIRSVVGVPSTTEKDSEGRFVGPDLVLVELDRDVANTTGSPACLWNPKQALPDEPTLLAAGWGNDAREPDDDNDLTWSQQNFTKNSGSIIVTKALKGHRATGSGDSGSGLILVHERRVYDLGPLHGGPHDILIVEDLEEPISYYTRAADHANFICHFTGVCIEGATAEGEYIEGTNFVVCEADRPCPKRANEPTNSIYDEDD